MLKAVHRVYGTTADVATATIQCLHFVPHHMPLQNCVSVARPEVWLSHAAWQGTSTVLGSHPRIWSVRGSVWHGTMGFNKYCRHLLVHDPWLHL